MTKMVDIASHVNSLVHSSDTPPCVCLHYEVNFRWYRIFLFTLFICAHSYSSCDIT